MRPGHRSVARYPVELSIAQSSDDALRDAAAAVRQESRAAAKRMMLQCTGVSAVAERGQGALFVLRVERDLAFDWSWEGAMACGPVGDSGRTADAESWQWTAEIVEVDEVAGHLYVSLREGAALPGIGPLVVRPFEFLAVLDAIYNDVEFEGLRGRLPGRLTAARGGVHPRVVPMTHAGLPELVDWWNYAWSILWGPPGTGKTHTSGQQLARVLEDPRERILVVSTTNRATDAIAVSIGRAASSTLPDGLARGELLRLGQGATPEVFEEHGLASMLVSVDREASARIDRERRRLARSESVHERAFARKQMRELQGVPGGAGSAIMTDPTTRLVVATAFKGLGALADATVRSLVESDAAPFTTVVIDEAGLVSRSHVAALSLLASRRVVLVGDARQLAPISRAARVMPARKMQWLASSALAHLGSDAQREGGVHLLDVQYRMHPSVCDVVSKYQYGGELETADVRVAEDSPAPKSLEEFARTIWYELDADDLGAASIRASRAPGTRSWIREATFPVLSKLLRCAEMRAAQGLFITPFRAQAVRMRSYFAQHDAPRWEASTVHSQQGEEADVVVFDTVHAGSDTWSVVEWKRLVNVALSRAREAVILIASRAEMSEPYLRELADSLVPAVLVERDDALCWVTAKGFTKAPTREGIRPGESLETARMGDQFASRRSLRPTPSQEQQRLSSLRLDGKPRLVRGAAGSGKSFVLCDWLVQTVRRSDTSARVWAVFANRSLEPFLRDSIARAWSRAIEGTFEHATVFPWERVELLHVKEILDALLTAAGIAPDVFAFDYDAAAEEYLRHTTPEAVEPCCTALFIDEAQDMGPSTLQLILSLVERSNDSDAGSRAAHIFYDNAQNVYGAKVPTWSEFGLDMRGRSTILRSSFRSTREIIEFAINTLVHLDPAGSDETELIKMGLVARGRRRGEPWLESLSSEVEGPRVLFRRFDERRLEMESITRDLEHLLVNEGVEPRDITVLSIGRARKILAQHLAPRLADRFGVDLSFQRSRAFERGPKTIVATSPHSFKGYESEVVLIPCVDLFVASGGKILARALYVAMTRARSLLALYGSDEGREQGRVLLDTLEGCARTQRHPSSDST